MDMELFNDNWSDQVDVVLELPHPCQYVYSCRTIIDEVNNGGFTQLYFNSTGEFAKLAEEGFSEIGSKKLADIMRQANDISVNAKLKLEEYDDGSIETFMKSYEEDFFNGLEDSFYKEIKMCDFGMLLVSYIRDHSDCFGK